MANVSEIQAHLAKLLMDEISLDAFEEWFFPYSLNIHEHGDAAAQELAYSIQHKLAEFDEDSPVLRQRLMEIILSSLMGPSASENISGDPVPPSKAEPFEKSGSNCVAA
jgi:hypothetical protein